MGVDFRMQAVRPKPDRKFERIAGDGLEFSTRLAILDALFRPGIIENSPAPLVRSLLPQSVSLRWFEKCYAGAYYDVPPPSAGDCWPPQEILDCLRATVGIFRDKADAFPPLYHLQEERTGERRGGWKAVFEGRVYWIRGDWGRCAATPAEGEPHIPYPPGDRTIDLRDTRSVRCRPITWGGLAPGKIGDVLWPGEVTLIVRTESCLDVFGPTLEEMISVASRAEAAGGLVFSFLA